MDEVLVQGKTQEEHDQYLQQVFQRLLEAGMILKSERCKFSQESVKFLGHVINGSGHRLHPEAIQKLPPAANVGDVRCFLGMVNQMSKFIPNLAEITQPVRELLVGDNLWTWGELQERDFKHSKEVLTSSPILALFNPNLETIVSADTSSFCIRTVQQQKQPTGHCGLQLQVLDLNRAGVHSDTKRSPCLHLGI